MCMQWKVMIVMTLNSFDFDLKSFLLTYLLVVKFYSIQNVWHNYCVLILETHIYETKNSFIFSYETLYCKTKL